MRVYLENSVTSARIRQDWPDPADGVATERIFAAETNGVLQIVTSAITAEEIGRISKELYRLPHTEQYNQIEKVKSSSTMKAMAPPFFGEAYYYTENEIYKQLRRVLPDRMDAEHVFQAVASGIEYLLTIDERTMLKHRFAVYRICGVSLQRPSEFVAKFGL